MHLNETEFLIALVLQYLAKQPDVVVIILVCLNAVNYGHKPLNYQVFQAVLLIQVSVNILLHGLPGLFTIFALLIKLYFLTVNIKYGVSKLLDAQLSVRYLPQLRHHGAAREDLAIRSIHCVLALLTGPGVQTAADVGARVVRLRVRGSHRDGVVVLVLVHGGQTGYCAICITCTCSAARIVILVLVGSGLLAGVVHVRHSD